MLRTTKWILEEMSSHASIYKSNNLIKDILIMALPKFTSFNLAPFYFLQVFVGLARNLKFIT